MPRPRGRRTALVAAVPATVVAAAWLRLESPRDDVWRAAAVVALALAAAAVRPAAARGLAAVAATAVAARLALGISPLAGFPARPGDGVAAAAGRVGGGVLDFYAVQVPFDPRVHVDMHAVVLAAAFAFALAVALCVAARRPLAAVLALVVGAGWPATLLGGAGAPGLGAAILLAALVVLAGLSGRRVPAATAPVAAALALVAAAVSTSPALARRQLVAWQRWSPGGSERAAVSVSYVWDAQYRGITWPSTATALFRVKAPGPSLYWRAAVLDDFAADHWLEGPARPGDGLEPAAARDPANQRREEVTIAALADTRLVGGGQPIAYSAPGATLVRPGPGIAYLPSGLWRGFRYSVRTYAPQPTAAQLRRSPPRYPRPLVAPGTFLDVWPGVTAPPFGAPGRAALLRRALAASPAARRYEPLLRAAERVAGSARTPYGAAAALDAWFRTSGGFAYANRPAPTEGPPLVGFVTRTRQGYCQTFAGAMALMLRYLGVPARVAVGFSSGTYDAGTGVWTVTDRDAHAWVEVWFRGYGWLPFDPTPAAGRPEQGTLSAPYVSRRGPARAGVAASAAGGAPGTGRAGTTAAVQDAAAAPDAPAGASSRGMLLRLLALALAATLAAAVLAKPTVRRLRLLTRDPRRLASACRRELADVLVDQRIAGARGASLHELGALVRHELSLDAGPFVAAATAARFGPPERAGPAALAARRELRLLVRGVRARLGLRRRVRGAVSVRSLAS